MKLISKIQYRKFDDDDESKKKFEGFAADETENIKRYERQVDLASQLNKLLDVRLTKSGRNRGWMKIYSQPLTMKVESLKLKKKY